MFCGVDSFHIIFSIFRLNMRNVMWNSCQSYKTFIWILIMLCFSMSNYMPLILAVEYTKLLTIDTFIFTDNLNNIYLLLNRFENLALNATTVINEFTKAKITIHGSVLVWTQHS